MHHLIFDSTHAILFAALVSVSLALEFNNPYPSTNIFRTWVLLMASRNLIKTTLLWIIELSPSNYVYCPCRRIHMEKFIDFIDFLGLLWFAFGNLLLLNYTDAIYHIPLLYCTLLAYISFTYLTFLSVCLFKCRLNPHPPSPPHTALERSLVALLTTNILSSGPAAHTNPSEVDKHQHAVWLRWLRKYGCVEGSYATFRWARGLEKGTESTDIESGSEEQNICSICLEQFVEHASTLKACGVKSPTSYSCELSLSQSQQEEKLATYGEGGSNGLSENSSHLSINNPSHGSHRSVLNSFITSPIQRPPSLPRPVSPPILSTCPHSPLDIELVVPYPCSASHLFHTTCLLSWLQVNDPTGGREEGKLTCPICREAPQHKLHEKSYVRKINL